MSWYTATTGNTWTRHPEPEFVDFRDFRTVQECDYAPMSVETFSTKKRWKIASKSYSVIKCNTKHRRQ